MWVDFGMNLLRDRFYKTSIVVYLVNRPANTDTNNKNCNDSAFRIILPPPTALPSPRLDVGRMAAISLFVTVWA